MRSLRATIWTRVFAPPRGELPVRHSSSHIAYWSTHFLIHTVKSHDLNTNGKVEILKIITQWYCIVLYYSLLYWMGGHCHPMHWDLSDLLCSPNLGIRTWLCRLDFAQRPIFSGLRFFNEPEISDSGPLKSLPEDLCSGFLRPKKSIDLSRIWTREPWISRRARYPETTEGDESHIKGRL